MAIDFINEQDFDTLLNERGDLCISIYLPMARKGADVQGNPLKLKNSLKDLSTSLQEAGWKQPKIDELLQEPRRLVDDALYWQHQQDGLALFIAPDFLSSYRLPLRFEPLTVAAERFHIKPLLPLRHDDGPFYILALSQNNVRLLKGTRNAIEEVDAEPVPTSLDEALSYDDPEERLQHHTTTSGSAGGPEVVHHGHSPVDEKRARLRRFVKDVADGVAQTVRNGSAPLVLAAVDYLHPMFGETFREPYLLDEGIQGNPENISNDALREQAWEIVSPHITRPRAEALQRFHSLAHGEQAENDVEHIVPAAFQGRVDTLFVALDAHVWGDYDPQANEVTIHEQATIPGEDLLDFAAVQTLANAGTVYALPASDMPEQSVIAAILRF